MPRRLLKFGLLVVMAAFVIAVQRDTFVRRWIVREPAGKAKLRELLPRVEIVNATLPRAATSRQW